MKLRDPAVLGALMASGLACGVSACGGAAGHSPTAAQYARTAPVPTSAIATTGATTTTAAEATATNPTAPSAASSSVPAIDVAAEESSPEDASRATFLKACATDDSASAFCECEWRELRKLASPAQIESGDFGQKAAFAKLDKGCSKLRPRPSK
jgi:hypothetical protein